MPTLGLGPIFLFSFVTNSFLLAGFAGALYGSPNLQLAMVFSSLLFGLFAGHALFKKAVPVDSRKLFYIHLFSSSIATLFLPLLYYFLIKGWGSVLITGFVSFFYGILYRFQRKLYSVKDSFLTYPVLFLSPLLTYLLVPHSGYYIFSIVFNSLSAGCIFYLTHLNGQTRKLAVDLQASAPLPPLQPWKAVSIYALPPCFIFTLIYFLPWITHKRSNETTVIESLDLRHGFRFTEEMQLGGLPIHRLYRNGIEKFNGETEQDVYRCLVTFPIELSKPLSTGNKKLLILGGADGLAARNSLIFSSVHSITIVDNDGALYQKAKEEPKLRIYNLDATNHKKVSFIKKDPIAFLMTNPDNKYDLIILESNEERYFTKEFLEVISSRLGPQGIISFVVPENLHCSLKGTLEDLNLSGSVADVQRGNRKVALVFKESADFETKLHKQNGVCRFKSMEEKSKNKHCRISSIVY